jgi:hypothetical protein
MKRFGVAVFPLLILTSCHLAPVNEQPTTLTVIWEPMYGPDIYNISPQSTTVSIYETGEQMLTPYSVPVAQKSFADIQSYSSNKLDFSASLGLSSKRYFIKIFNAFFANITTAQGYNNVPAVEHNLNDVYQLNQPLMANATTGLRVITHIHYVEEYTVHPMAIYNFPELSSDPYVGIAIESKDEYGNGGVIYYSNLSTKVVPIVINDLSIPFGGKWPTFFIKIYGSAFQKVYEINMVKLLNSNKTLDGLFYGKDSNSSLTYSLSGELIIK